MQHGERRSLVVDGLKALAAMLIVLHHLAFYGPMAHHAGVMLPGLRDWLAGDARMAVQVFLVVGGFLAARSLAAIGPQAATLLPAIRNRFLRLALPYHVVLLLAVACNELARRWMSHDSISAPAGAGQLLAHALLLQDVLGYESLSAGLWYVAIDLQLFVLLAVLWWLGGHAEDAGRRLRLPRRLASVYPAALFVCAMGLASLVWFNRQPTLESWGIYFFGSYAVGVLAWWASSRPHRAWWITAIAACAAIGLWVEVRERLVLAVTVALVLALFAGPERSTPAAVRDSSPDSAAWIWRRLRGSVHWLAGISYAMFLVHFPVCLVVNAAFSRFAPLNPGWQSAGLAFAVAASLVAGAVFHSRVEAPLLRWLTLRRSSMTTHPAMPRSVAPDH